MKRLIPLILILVGCISSLNAQVTTPIIVANFGIDADLSANSFNSAISPGSDDWFNQNPLYTTGVGVIDTTGAATITANYVSDPSSRNLSFTRSMAYPPYSVVNSKTLIDAVFIRDYHGNDSTVSNTGASKNGQSPQVWSTPVSQNIPDKNDILDMMAHVRRDGPNSTDSLWLFGGISIENTSGDRYFDFEMYQTDIYYDRPTLSFKGYGPDAGHTSWQFDASGNITSPGDIILSADYGSSNLSYIDARIWVDSSALSLTPANFNWTGTFDGAGSGSKYGYAGIAPKVAGTFYVGTENTTKTPWAGPFKLVRENNSLNSSYILGQYMEFGVNLTKLGLDPVTLLGGSCGIPFRRMLVKTRASTSFTAALKDFVGPIIFFEPLQAQVAADTTLLCGLVGVATLRVTDPVSTSIYTWTTLNGGHIQSYLGDTAVVVDAAGTYVVTQQLQSGCGVYAQDTITIRTNGTCYVLGDVLKNFSARLNNNNTFLNWSVMFNDKIDYFQIEKSVNGINFSPTGTIQGNHSDADIVNYTSSYELSGLDGPYIYFRLKLVGIDGSVAYSKVVKLFISKTSSVTIAPNCFKDKMTITISAAEDANMNMNIYDFTGKRVRNYASKISKGISSIEFNDFQGLADGLYIVKVDLGNESFIDRIILRK